MENKKLKLPVGIPTFEKLRKEGCVYVDKTKYLVDLIDTGSIYFLARPRRFGKTLTVTTFDALFSGKKELFQGLYAEEFLNRPDFLPSPVIRLDTSKVTTNKGIEGLEASILMSTREVAKKLDVELSGSQLCGDLFRELIVATAQKYGQQVVVLLDEYDKPYTDFVNDTEMANNVRKVLRNYYVQIKAYDEYIRFTFITGISKFAKFGVFSTLNTLEDISMLPEYAAICGYTEEEIIQYFPDYLDATAQKMKISVPELIDKMRYYYNGFCFDRDVEARLFNPFSTLLFLKQKFFDNFWFESGSSKMIADYMKNRNLTVEQFRRFPVSLNFVRTPGDMDVTPPEGFLYQGGYLTLRPDNMYNLVLDYPNTEVLNAMSELVSQNILQHKDESFNHCQSELLQGLVIKDKDVVISAFNRLLACVAYDDYTSAAQQSILYNRYAMQPQEWLYRASIFSFLHGCGVVVAAEMHTNKGRPDLVIAYKNATWVIEIKVAYAGQSAETKADEAMKQIMDNHYTSPYPDAICLGLGIDNELRQITASRT